VPADEWMRRLAHDPEPFLLRLEFTAKAARDRELRRKLETRISAVPLALRRLIEESAESEGLELPLPADEVALALQALGLGLALEALGNPGAVRPGIGGDVAALLIELLAERDSQETR
jgi:hypothetical protein